MPYVCSVSGAAAITQSARAISRSRSAGPWTPDRAVADVFSADQVTMGAALPRLGTRAAEPHQALLDRAAREGPALPEEQEGWA